MEYAENWSVSRAYHREAFVRTPLPKAAYFIGGVPRIGELALTLPNKIIAGLKYLRNRGSMLASNDA